MKKPWPHAIPTCGLRSYRVEETMSSLEKPPNDQGASLLCFGSGPFLFQHWGPSPGSAPPVGTAWSSGGLSESWRSGVICGWMLSPSSALPSTCPFSEFRSCICSKSMEGSERHFFLDSPIIVSIIRKKELVSSLPLTG